MSFLRRKGMPRGWEVQSGDHDVGEKGSRHEAPDLAQRLRMLVQTQRELVASLEREHEERRAREKAEADNRLRAMNEQIEAAVATAESARREALEAEARQVELEEALGDALAKAESIAGDLVRAERRAEEAEKAMKPRAARKVARLERELEDSREQLAEARAQAERERADRARVEHELAQRSLEKLAAESATKEWEAREREQERLIAIEKQLKDLIGSGGPAKKEPVPPVLEELSTAEGGDAKQGPGGGTPSRASRRRRRRRSRQLGGCAVCGKPPAEGTDPEGDGGWMVVGKTGLCPDCQGEGWQLPAGGGLPHRPVSDTDRSA
jgi:hypothetical protein